jgi:hypothetical protein
MADPESFQKSHSDGGPLPEDSKAASHLSLSSGITGIIVIKPLGIPQYFL